MEVNCQNGDSSWFIVHQGWQTTHFPILNQSISTLVLGGSPTRFPLPVTSLPFLPLLPPLFKVIIYLLVWGTTTLAHRQASKEKEMGDVWTCPCLPAGDVEALTQLVSKQTSLFRISRIDEYKVPNIKLISHFWQMSQFIFFLFVPISSGDHNCFTILQVDLHHRSVLVQTVFPFVFASSQVLHKIMEYWRDWKKTGAISLCPAI